MSRYDFGMRGYPQTTRPLRRKSVRRPRYDPSVDPSHPATEGDAPPPNRVSRRYNPEYLNDQPDAARGYGGRFPDEV